MPITFTPRRSAILMCNFERAFVMPEMRKKRRVIVVSPTTSNKWTAQDPGSSIVVPLSATPPWGNDPRSVPIPSGRYVSITRDVWAKCGMVATMSNSRLDRVFAQGRRSSEFVTPSDMAQIEAALRVSLDLP